MIARQALGIIIVLAWVAQRSIMALLDQRKTKSVKSMKRLVSAEGTDQMTILVPIDLCNSSINLLTLFLYILFDSKKDKVYLLLVLHT